MGKRASWQLQLGALLGVGLLLAAVPRPAPAMTITNVWYLDIAATWPGDDFVTRRQDFRNPPYIARWGIYGMPVTNINGQNVPVDNAYDYTIVFKTMTNFYLSTNRFVLAGSGDSRQTNFYLPFSNSLSVTIEGTNGMASSVVWSFSSYPDEFTNSSAYKGAYTNTCFLSPIPTGQYLVSLPAKIGYTAVNPGTNITGESPQDNGITGIYTRAFGTITVTVSPTNGQWTFVTHPADATNVYVNGVEVNLDGYTGTDNAVITNVPLGAYRIHFLDLPGLATPADQTKTNGTPEYPTDLPFSGSYISGPAVYVTILKPEDHHPVSTQCNLAGLGYGWYSVDPAAEAQLDQSGVYHFPTGTVVTLSAYPTNATFITTNGGVVATNTYESFFYQWYDRTNLSLTTDLITHLNTHSNITFTLGTNDAVFSLLFSREYETYDNIGDIDHDHLPDEWERVRGLNELDDGSGTNKGHGRSGNPDGDWIPSTAANPPWIVTISNRAASYQVATGSSSLNPYPGYPLRGNRLYSPGAVPDGYARTNIAFNNDLECRGLDGFYLANGCDTNGTDAACPIDDPYTDPLSADTDGDGMGDGWEYYFWYWRSANAFQAGLSNSADLAWVMISPSDQRILNGGFAPSDAEWDTDNDGFLDGDEYALGLDPTHADTDGDSMDDYWETAFASTNQSPFNALDGLANPDDDYISFSAAARVLTNGTVGILITNPVCYFGDASWVDYYTNFGAAVFDLYQDAIIALAAPLSNRVQGATYTNPVFYAVLGDTNATGSNTFYKTGYPVWVDRNNSSNYSAGDLDLYNPLCKNEYVYLHDIEETGVPFPGVASFSPIYAWSHVSHSNLTTNAVSYVSHEEYVGGNYLGRLSWTPGGFVPYVGADNDGEPIPGKPFPRTAYTHPGSKDTDGDLIPDGWELYVGLNPNNVKDGAADSDGDGLKNFMEWANTLDPLGSVSNLWPLKKWPTDPGVLVAPPPNDPHPKDTDWDGLSDGQEFSIQMSAISGNPEDTNTIEVLSNPAAYDSDGDMLPDGWELYGGTQVGVGDSGGDYDGDGLANWREYWTGTVPEWQLCDAQWDAKFCARLCMQWDPWYSGEDPNPFFVPPDFYSCPSFLYFNGVITDVALLRAMYPAGGSNVATLAEYHTARAINPDSDADGMDDFWEVYHGLNPLKGLHDLALPAITLDRYGGGGLVGAVDADPAAPGFQFGLPGMPFDSLAELIAHVPADLEMRYLPMTTIVGPFNFGLDRMDPDGDGLPNAEEYSYAGERSLYHTDPTPIWRTDDRDDSSFTSLNYTYDNIRKWFILMPEPVFPHEQVEGFDTDNDGVGDYNEINAAAGLVGSDPLDARNPTRNRAAMFNGAGDFLRNLVGWFEGSESSLTRFSVEAWVRPRNPDLPGNQVVLEKAGLFVNPYTMAQDLVRANFRMGVIGGLPYVLYNGRGAMTTNMATANIRHRLKPDVWTHLAGVYDGQTLTIYVNGEASSTLNTTEIPATGYEFTYGPFIIGTAQSIIVGARDLTPGATIPDAILEPTDYFNGFIDEVRIWDVARSRAQIIANKDRCLATNEVYQNGLWSYFTFDDVPDPAKEGIVPAGMAILDTTLSFHPTMDWWSSYPLRSTVYTGSAARPYNYLVTAADHVRARPVQPPRDDYYHFSTNYAVTNLVGYRNTYNPYGEETYRWAWHIELGLFRGARAVATNSWLASLDPNDPDSMDSDGDGLPDWWEQQHGLDPHDATGDNGAWGDPDHDGLNNRAEYLAGTNPRMWDTDGDGLSDYDSRRERGARTWGEIYMDGDGMPDSWEIQNGLDPYRYDAHLDADGDGWSNYAEFQAGTDPTDPDSHPTPSVSGTVHYYGTNNNGLASIEVWGRNETNLFEGRTVSWGTACDAEGKFTLYGLKEGIFTLFGFMDLNGDSHWNSTQVGALSTTEPAGQSEENPHELGWADVSGVRVGVSDLCPGYVRLIWETLPLNAPNIDYDVWVNRVSEQNAPQVFTKRKTVPVLGEWDFQQLGIYGLPTGAYQWWVGSNYFGSFPVDWPSGLAKPTLLSPLGDSLYSARNMIRWSMDAYSTRYHLQVARRLADGSYQMLADGYYPAPYRDADGGCSAYLPEYASVWGNGPLSWRVAGWSPIGESEWSDVSTFNLDLSTTNSCWISGDVYYFGKARATNLYVEVFDNPGFGGAPAARAFYTAASPTNTLKASFALHGLQRKTYYLRAYADITPAGGARNGRLDSWESWGFVKDPFDDYRPRAIVLTNTCFAEQARVVIRDRDTDNDELPDAWEMYYFGTLAQSGDMDYDGDGENNLTEYALDFLDTDPTLFDTDGDGLSDSFELRYGNPVFYDPYDPVSNLGGQSLKATAWDTDGDGYSDGAELRRYHTKPLDPASYPAYAPACVGPGASAADYDGRSDLSLYEPATGTWRLWTWQGWNREGPFGTPGTQPLLGDYDGDGLADAALFEPASGTWFVYTMRGERGSRPFGDAAMTPVPADYDGDFRTDLGVYDPQTGMWYLYAPVSGAFLAYQFGNAACVPVPGDYDGDARSDIAVYHAADGAWYVFTWRGEFSAIPFGRAGCLPVPGDYDGDGRCDIGVYDPVTAMWHLATWTGQTASGQFGWGGGIPVVGDYDGDGRRDAGLYDPATGMWYLHTMSGLIYKGQFGSPGSMPILGGR